MNTYRYYQNNYMFSVYTSTMLSLNKDDYTVQLQLGVEKQEL